MDPILRKLLKAGKDDCLRLCASDLLLIDVLLIVKRRARVFMAFSLWNAVWGWTAITSVLGGDNYGMGLGFED